MFCRKCGNELKDGVKFCTKCGTPVTPAVTVNPASNDSNPVKPVQQPVQKTVIRSDERAEELPEQKCSQQEAGRLPEKKTEHRASADGRTKRTPASRNSRKNENNKLLTIIMIIVLVVAILVAAAAAIYLLKPEWFGLDDKTNVVEIEDESEEGEEDETSDDDDSEAGKDGGSAEEPAEEVPEATEETAEAAAEEPVEEEVVFEEWDLDVGKECASISSMVSDYESCLGNYKKYTMEDGNIIAYVQEGIPVKVIVKKGYKNWNYSREYYGVDSFYTKIYDDMGTRELYYSGSKLCRIIDENGIAHDYNSENWAEYNELAEKADKDKSEIKQFIRDNI